MVTQATGWLTRAVRWLAPGMLGLALTSGCSGGGPRAARALAEAQLACRGSALLVDPIGELVIRPRQPVTLSLHDAHGCGRAQLYLCLDAEPTRCVTDPSRLGKELAPLAARALYLRRTVSRARCPAFEERVVQESESLWRFEACDGTWTLHCTSRPSASTSADCRRL